MMHIDRKRVGVRTAMMWRMADSLDLHAFARHPLVRAAVIFEETDSRTKKGKKEREGMVLCK